MVAPELVGRLERLCSPSLYIRARAEIAAGSRRRRGENAEPNALDRQNRFPLQHPRSSALRRTPTAAFGRVAADNATGIGAALGRRLGGTAG